MSASMRERLSPAIPRLAGAVLCCAGVLKLAGGQSRSELPGFAPAWMTAAAPALELLVGLWLLSGLFRFAAHLTALLTFGVFGLVAYSQVRAGASDCGCFGSAVTVPP